MNEYEIHGRLLEISLVLGCNVLDLISIKKQISEKGFTAENKRQLRELGMIVNDETFEQCIKSFSDRFGIISTNITESSFFKLDQNTKHLFKAIEKNKSLN